MEITSSPYIFFNFDIPLAVLLIVAVIHVAGKRWAEDEKKGDELITKAAEVRREAEELNDLVKKIDG